MLLQKDSWSFIYISYIVPLELKESIVEILSYTLFTSSIPLLYSFPSQDKPDSSFLSLLLQLALQHPHTTLRNTILSLLANLLELGSYPVHPLLSPAVKLMYPSLTSLMAEGMKNEMTEEELCEVIRVTTTVSKSFHYLWFIVREVKSVMITNQTINLDLICFLFYITSLPSQNLASLTLDSWFLITVRITSFIHSKDMNEFYIKSVLPDHSDCYTTLLRMLRNQLLIPSYQSLSSDTQFILFNTPQNQLQLLQTADSMFNWKPSFGDDSRTEPFPAILEFETTPFRHGPPGCEDLLRSLYANVGEELIQWLSQDLLRFSEEVAEADLFVISQMLNEITSNREENPMVGYYESLPCRLLLSSKPVQISHNLCRISIRDHHSLFFSLDKSLWWLWDFSHFLLNSLLQSFKLSIPLLLACLLNPHRVHTQLICCFFSQCITAIIWRILGLSHHYWFLTLFIWIVEFIIELFHCCIRSLQISQNLDHSPSRWVYDSSTWDSAESTRSIVAWCESIWENCFCLWMYDGPVYISSSIPALWFYKTKSDM